jgi:diguanylate cyclase (GGDEF)-like protein/PAS domain S-box-containing protein
MGASQYSIFFIIDLIASCMILYLAGYAWRHRNARGAKSFALLMLAIFIWIFSIAVGMLAQKEDWNFFWAVIRMLGVIAVPGIWLAFALQFSDRSEWLTLSNISIYSIIPFVSFILMTTTSTHKLFVADIHYKQICPFLIDAIWELGPWFWVHAGYSYLSILTGGIIILYEAIRMPPQYKRQAITLLIGAVFPLLTNLSYSFHLIPGLDVNYDPFGFVFAGIAFASALFKFRLFDLKPIARKLLIDSMSDSMVVVDENYRLVDINPSAIKVFSDISLSHIGTPIDDIIHTGSPFHKLIQQGLEKHHEVCRGKSSEERIYDLRISVIQKAGQVGGYLLVFRDITDRKKLEFTLHELSITDSLTQIYNHRHFYVLGEREIIRSLRFNHPCVVLMIDIDDFKKINDTFGHPVGDDVLKQLSKLLKNELRSTDILARYGGEEFSVILPETDLEKSIFIAERLLMTVDQAFFSTSAGQLRISVSIGGAMLSGAQDTFRILINKADEALYQSKAKGKNRVTFWKEN